MIYQHGEAEEKALITVVGRYQDEIVQLRNLLKQAHSTIKHGAATAYAQASILNEIEKAVGMKTEAELLKSES